MLCVPMQGSFAPSGEYATILRCHSRERVVVQLDNTLAVVCLLLRRPMDADMYLGLARAASALTPCPCRVSLGYFDLAKMEFTSCSLMDVSVPTLAWRRESSPPAKPLAQIAKPCVFQRVSYKTSCQGCDL